MLICIGKPDAGASMSRGEILALPRDGRLLFLTRFIRLFSYGSLSVILVFYLTGLGLTERQTGTLLTLIQLGDTSVSLGLTTHAAPHWPQAGAYY